jgi:glycerophosphoryl diester phosphodiesterase
MPENTLPAFLKAVEIGVTTLEMDVVISKDGQVVVSHEPWMSSKICSHPDGKPVTKEEEMSLNLYKMNYDEIQTYDCGLSGHPDFPEQMKLQNVKPTLKMVIRSVRKFADDTHIAQPKYNIEIKSDPKGYNVYQPEPKEFVEKVVTELQRLDIEGQVILQSFDVNVLEELHKRPGHTYAISYLVEKGKTLNKNLSKLTFKPEIYSPDYMLVTEDLVKDCHSHGIRIIPWTVNVKEDMERLKGWGVDGGISDYPDRMITPK